MFACISLAAQGTAAFGQIVTWLVVLMALVVVGGAAIFIARRFLHSETARPEGFSLQSLRDMHKAGELSDEEYEQARAAMVGRATGGRPPATPERTSENSPDNDPSAAG
jgi:hypothetical protein